MQGMFMWSRNSVSEAQRKYKRNLVSIRGWAIRRGPFGDHHSGGRHHASEGNEGRAYTGRPGYVRSALYDEGALVVGMVLIDLERVHQSRKSWDARPPARP